MYLTSLDDIFTSQKERDEIDLEKVKNISLKEIDDFPQHPFRVEIDEDMLESIKSKGVIQPVLVRPKADGRYELISGHRRKKASEQLNIDTIPCIVRELDDNEATILMVDSNYQRDRILPSEKAFAYKMKMEAMNNQGARTDLTLSQVDTKLDTATIIGREFNDSRATVFRHIRFTYLLPQLLKYVDNSVIKDKEMLSMALSPAEQISFLTKQQQKCLLDYIDFNRITPSQAQAIDLREMSENGSMNRLNKVLPRTLITNQDREDYVIKAVEFYVRYQRQREQKAKER